MRSRIVILLLGMAGALALAILGAMHQRESTRHGAALGDVSASVRNLQEEVFRQRTDLNSVVRELAAVGSLQRELALLRAAVGSSERELARLRNDFANRVPTLVGLRAVELQGQKAKALSYMMKPGVEVVDSIVGNRFDATWRWHKEGDLPIPWPQIYRETYRQDFAPFFFLANARQIAAAVRADVAAEDYRKSVPYLLRQLTSHTERQDDAMFVVYRFPFDDFARHIEKNWRSAFGNAMALLGLIELSDATGDAKLLALAGAYVRGLLAIGIERGITRVDQAGYLWFEEYPEPMQGVVNGHIATLFALYRYGERTGDVEVTPYLVAAATTMRRYLPTVRRPGAVSAYGLFDLTAPDYGPERIIRFTRMLEALTGDHEFGVIATAFETDMPLP